MYAEIEKDRFINLDHIEEVKFYMDVGKNAGLKARIIPKNGSSIIDVGGEYARNLQEKLND